jgi:homoserine dehydrogenase
MTLPLRVGIAGLGTVGGGTVKLLHDARALVGDRATREVVVTAVSARNREKASRLPISNAEWVADPRALALSDKVDVVVEVIGGSDVGREVIEAAIAHRKHVVTANKSLLAEKGTALARAAEAKGVSLCYEAAVAGGIPIIKALREGLIANRVTRLTGILNGTCNYILTQMEATGRSFHDVLREAQELGYAEADPTLDVGGHDTAHKLAILASLAFGSAVDLAGVHTEGIDKITPHDIGFAREFGYRIKLLGVARHTEHGVEQRVHPAMVPLDTPLADVHGVFNAIVTESDYAGKSVFEGRGAGEGPTASAVVADLVDIARGLRIVPFVKAAASLAPPQRAAPGERTGPAYLRFTVLDKPGVLATIAGCLSQFGVSIESMIQRGRSSGEPVPIVMITHDAREADLNAALELITRERAVTEPPCRIRMERV